MSTVETDRLVLRPWSSADVDNLAAVFAEPDVWRYPFGRGLSRAESEQFLDRQLEHWQTHGFGVWAAEQKADHRLIGYIGRAIPTWLPQVLPAVEVGWRLHPDSWGKGLATEGGRASLRHGFETLALDRIISIFTADNASSGRVMDKLGMYDCLTTTDAERGIPLLVREITLEGWQQSLPAGPEEDQPHTRRASRPDTMANTCSHLDTIVAVEPSSKGCEDCLRVGSNWVHLRLCMGCGHVGCCDSSPNRHATAHWRANSDHPLVRSYEPGEDWWWCYADELAFEVPDGPPSPSHP